MANQQLDPPSDFDDADRGLIGRLEPAIVTSRDGRVVWDNDAYGFLAGPCPETAHPGLWRQGQLVSRQGLYEVTEGIYQVRGLDLSNMTLVEGERGVIVIDPLISKETAAAAMALYGRYRGQREVTGLIYTHAHVDHFGGAHGVAAGDDIPILAPTGFLESAVSENVYAGVAMSRRALYMYGSALDKGPAGQIGCGLGMTTSTGSVGLIPPTVMVTHTGQEEIIDGVRIRFQLTPGTECPAEMNFLFPDRRALCLAENATHNLHNLVTLRGAVVRDAKVWATYLDEAVDLFADHSEVAFASHHWPTWGRQRIVEYLSLQRDLYAYLHDQTLRLINQGHTGAEAAEMLTMPPALEAAWHTHGYYGSVSHNVKAIYQRYLGWFDGNPANLWPHPPEASSTRYVECMGGPAAVVAKAAEYRSTGDLRFAAELLNLVVFAGPGNTEAKERLADIYEQLGYGSENGTWRNFYLTGAHELRHGVHVGDRPATSKGLIDALSVEQLFDAIAIRVNGPRAWSEALVVDWRFTDLGDTHRMTLRHGVLTHRLRHPLTDMEVDDAGPELTLILTKSHMATMLGGGGFDGIDHEGDVGAIGRLLAVLDRPDPNFAIVTPA
jgi:alkyl sulfatase BDS1-like metallo-beta-lactamase superfamily hydrolase